MTFEQGRQTPEPNTLRDMTVSQRTEYEARLKASNPSGSNHGRRAAIGVGLVMSGALIAEALTGGGIFPRLTSADNSTPGPSAAPTVPATEKPSQAPGTPTPEPTKSPEPSGSPEASPANIQNIEVKQYQPFEVQVGDWISADVTMSDTEEGLKDETTAFPLFDSDYDYLDAPEDQKVDITRTAMGVDIQAPGWVVAPYGDIVVVRGMTPDQKAFAIANEIALKTRGKQFDAFDIVLWKGLDNTISQAGKMHDGTLVGKTGENPTGFPTAENLANFTTLEKLNIITKFFHDNEIDPTSKDAQDLLALLAACLCGCAPTESPAPSALPTPEPTGAVCTPKMTDKVIAAGTVWHSNGVDFIIQGDVTIDGKKRYTVGDPNNDKSIDWYSDGKDHTVVFDYRSNRSLFTCASDSFEKDQYNHVLGQDSRPLDPKSVIDLK